MVITILFVVWVLIALADLIRAILLQRRLKRERLKADIQHVEIIEAWARLEIALKKDLDATMSIKRWMRALIAQLDQSEDNNGDKR